MRLHNDRLPLIVRRIMALAGCALRAGAGALRRRRQVRAAGRRRLCRRRGAASIGQCRALAGADLSAAPSPDLGARATWRRRCPTAGTRTRWPRPAASTATARSRAPRRRSRSGWARSSRSTPPAPTCRSTTCAHNDVWDFSAPSRARPSSSISSVDPSGQWWAADFPTATYGERIDDGQQALRRLPVGTDKLEMLGVVSEQRRRQPTELTYTTPIVVLRVSDVGRHAPGPRESDVSGHRQRASPSSRTRSTCSASTSAA